MGWLHNDVLKKPRETISLGGDPREYCINKVKYLVESRYAKADQGTANRTIANAIEDIIKSDYIDLSLGKDRSHN